ncbi:anti-phage protein KwaA [Epilithonimonas xixisoli]|uniref:Uncharacterized protein n=1 Tax=Epilithonimonas xixisoli TaxID=1476462 RepID=A0A4R8IIX9_9FLAO|nr:anti-phage protein KwaA [Epilithonimonas xixisoli]TDX86569.1 hypothetical protein B0I22_0703 [Epilithonimonas xixisoli]
MRKIGLFFLSMWLFFALTIIITGHIPLYYKSDWAFIGWEELLCKNIIPLLCLAGILIGIYSYFDFRFSLKDATNMPFTIKKIEGINYEHLTFLTTYIVPLVCFNFDNTRYQIVLLFLLIVICAIYVKTDLFYANPTLALLGFKIYKIDGNFEDGAREGIILISKENLSKDIRCDYIKLDERIYYAKIKQNDQNTTN